MSLRPIAAPQKHTDRPLATCVGSLRPAAHMACLEVPIENEPTMPEYSGAPTGYDATAYARDVAAFRTFAENVAPDMKIVGPAVVGEDELLLATSGSNRPRPLAGTRRLPRQAHSTRFPTSRRRR